jgi:hypothetical protein
MTTMRRAARSLGAAALAGVLLGPLVPGAGAAAAAVPTDGEAGIGDPYWPLDGNGGIDVASYSIRNRYSFDDARLTGRTRLALTATKDLSSFSLDFLLDVSKVTVDGTPARFVTLISMIAVNQFFGAYSSR